MRGRPLGGDCLESRTLGNKHSSLIIKKDASWGSLLRLRRGKEVGGKGLVGGVCSPDCCPYREECFRKKRQVWFQTKASLSKRCKQRRQRKRGGHENNCTTTVEFEKSLLNTENYQDQRDVLTVKTNTNTRPRCESRPVSR